MTQETEPDTLVPDRQVRVEMGGISEMTVSRWDRDPVMAEKGWPPAIKIHRLKYRSRQQLETFKHNMLTEALKTRRTVTAAAQRKSVKRRVVK